MVEDVNIHLTSLLAAGATGNLEHTIIPMILGKLPMELGLAWRNVAETGDRSVDSFLYCSIAMEEGVDRPVACLSYITRREIQNREAVQEFWNNESVQTVTDGYSRSTFAASHGSRSTVEALAIRTRSPSSQGLR